jgi:hypothetical protein
MMKKGEKRMRPSIALEDFISNVGIRWGNMVDFSLYDEHITEPIYLLTNVRLLSSMPENNADPKVQNHLLHLILWPFSTRLTEIHSERKWGDG